MFSMSTATPVPKVRPLRGYVLLQLDDPEKKIGSIIIPESAQEKSLRGTVLATGPGSWNEAGTRRWEPGVKKGDHVLIGKYAGTDLAGGRGKRFEAGQVLVLEDEILAVIEGES